MWVCIVQSFQRKNKKRIQRKQTAQGAGEAAPGGTVDRDSGGRHLGEDYCAQTVTLRVTMGAGCTRCVTAVRSPTDSEPKADVLTRVALDEPERAQHKPLAARRACGDGIDLEIPSRTASRAQSRSSSLSRDSTPRTSSGGQPHVALDSGHDHAPPSTRVPVPPSAISRRERSAAGVQAGKLNNQCSQKDASAAVGRGGKLVPLPPRVGAVADRAPETCATVGTFGSGMPSALWQRRYGKQGRGAAQAPSFLRVPFADREHCS